MKRTLITILLLASFSQLLANNNWEKAYEFERFNLEHVEYLSPNSFIISTNFNSERNGNITFEYALQLTKDMGKTWKRIYQDSTSVSDIPKQALRIVDLKVNENGIITLLREDGYILFSKDEGEKWDSVKTSISSNKVGLMQTNKNSVLIYYKRTDSLFFLDLDTKKIETIYFPEPVFKGGEETLNITGFAYLTENNIIFSCNKTNSDTTFNYTYLTTDRGENWDYYERENSVGALYFIDENLGYSCGVNNLTTNPQKNFYACIDKTTDGGKTWENLYLGEPNIIFREIEKAGNQFICLTKYTLFPRSSTNMMEWEVDSVVNAITSSGPPMDVACDGDGNCIMVMRAGHIQKLVNASTSVVEIPNLDSDYFVEYYDLQGNKMRNVIADSDLPNGLYLKAFRDKNNVIAKTEKLIITN